MAVAARILEEPQASRAKMPPPGFLRLFGTVIEQYGHDAFQPTEMDASVEVGPASGVYTLTVPVDQVDDASQFAAALCVAVEEQFGERYMLLVVSEPEDD